MSTTTLGDLAAAGVLELGDGYRTKRGEHGRPGYRILRVADVGDGAVRADGPDFVSEDFVRQIGPKAARAGDVLLTTKGTVGRVAIMPEHTEPVVYSPQLCYFRILDPSRLSARWLAYWFKSGEFLMQASHRANNTDMAAYINLADIRSLVLPDVDVRKQRGIAEVLGALDDKIAANRRAERASVELIGALYKRAVEGGARKRPFLDVLDVDFGEPFKGASFSEAGVGRPLIRIRDLKTFKSQVWTTEVRQRETIVEPGDVVFGMDAEFRATWWLGEEGLLNQRVCRVRSKDFGLALVAPMITAPLISIERAKSATTVIHLNKRDLEQAKVVVPESGKVDEFENLAEPVLAHRVQLARESRLLAQTRDEILPLLMSGKVRVKDAEKVVEGVV
jgi:type I restriction enzyme S subunit